LSSKVIGIEQSQVGCDQIYKFSAGIQITWKFRKVSEGFAMDLARVEYALESAWARRAPLRARTDAYRLLNGAASGTPGLIVDVFAGIVIVYAYDKVSDAGYGDLAALLAGITGAEGVALKDRSARDELGREEGKILFGEVPETAEVREGPLRFRVHPRHPRNVGLFLDTRVLRQALVESCRGHDVLNLFSYSCSLGIAAGKENAGSVVNVDVSSRYLGWGKDNLALNGMAPEKMKFVRMDSGRYLDWAEKKTLAFDAIILDPPSFSRSEAGIFSFASDYWVLLGKCARLLRPGGRLYALTNFGGIAPDRFRRNLEDTLLRAGRAGAEIHRLTLPEDFDGAGEADARESMDRVAAKGNAAVEGTLLAFAALLQ
jgi:23S rRNA (cytosine1962-C5)-methyltransferase